MSSFLYWINAVLGAAVGVVGIRTSEEPKYTLLLREESIEIREYSSTLQAVVQFADLGSSEDGAAFRVLANYIFGENEKSEKMKMTAPVEKSPSPSQKIAMTAPVFVSRNESGFMAFVLPSTFTMDTLPKPKDSRVRIVNSPPKIFAVVRFNGDFSDENCQEHQTLLEKWLVARPDYEADGEAKWAGYDPPFTIPALRHNEVLIPVRPKN